jgi:fatty-acid peroxygenase
MSETVPPEVVGDLSPNSALPTDPSFDATLAFLSQGYDFISNRCRALGSDAFQTRVLGMRVTCMQGAEAARLFYGGGNFTRRGAIPPTTLRLLQDRGSVQTLDGAAHRHRKQMFLAMMGGASVARLADELERAFRIATLSWSRRDEVVLHDEARALLCDAVCAWAGVPLHGQLRARTAQLGAMIEGAGSFGARAAWGLVQRSRAERWARSVVDRVRARELPVGEERPLHVVAHHLDDRGLLLDRDVAAVELLNLLRPTVAVARWIVFGALALHEHPHAREDLLRGDGGAFLRFAQEVRRFYPFFPAVGGRAREPLTFRGHRLSRGAWVLFDLHGTNHDPRIWGDPEVFRPARFVQRPVGFYDLVPQGAGDAMRDHRCAGEDASVALTSRAVRLLVEAIDYVVPTQDLRVSRTRMPTLPASGFVLRQVRLRGR